MGLTTSLVKFDNEQVIPPLLVDNDHLWQADHPRQRRLVDFPCRPSGSNLNSSDAVSENVYGKTDPDRTCRDTCWHPSQSGDDTTVCTTVVGLCDEPTQVASVDQPVNSTPQRRRPRSSTSFNSSSTDATDERFCGVDDGRRTQLAGAWWPYSCKETATVPVVRTSLADSPLQRVNQPRSTVACIVRPPSSEFSTSRTAGMEAIADMHSSSSVDDVGASMDSSQPKDVFVVVTERVCGGSSDSTAANVKVAEGLKLTQHTAALPIVNDNRIMSVADAGFIRQAPVCLHRDDMRSNCKELTSDSQRRRFVPSGLRPRVSLPDAVCDDASFENKRMFRKRRSNSDSCTMAGVAKLMSNETEMSGACALIQFHDPVSALNVDNVDSATRDSVQRLRKRPVVGITSNPLTNWTCSISESVSQRRMPLISDDQLVPETTKALKLSGDARVGNHVDFIEMVHSDGRQDDSVNNSISIVDVDQMTVSRPSTKKSAEADDASSLQCGDGRRTRRAALRDTRVYGFDISPDYLEQLAAKVNPYNRL